MSSDINSATAPASGIGPHSPPTPMPSSTEALAPVAAEERIEALDVVRGFALFGIFLMNVEFFGRAMSGIGEGMPLGLTGVDWLASWFVAYFVQGKFWTIFSLLFGMGFAVMLTRAERGGRAFLKPYLRRILALAVFGAVHYIFLWEGDILFSYAVGALCLLILLYGRMKWTLAGIAVAMGAAFIPGLGPVGAIAAALGFIMLIGLYLHGGREVKIRGHAVPLLALLLGVPGALATLGAVVLWALPDGPREPRIPMTVMGPAFVVLGVLAAKYQRPVELRALRLGVTVYIFSFSMMTLFGLARYLQTPEAVPPALVAAAAERTMQAEIEGKGDKSAKAAKEKEGESTKTADPMPSSTPGKPAEKSDADKKLEKKAEREADRLQRLKEHAQDKKEEVRILSSGTWAEAVRMRARHFPEKAANDFGFASVLMGMFMLGYWFVRSGIMANPGAHLPMFRKLALYGLPVGIGLGLAGSVVAMSHTPGTQDDGWTFAQGLSMLGNLPACLGYVGLVVVMLHSRGPLSNIRVLAPVGRMALSNYLLQSLIGTTFFYGYALGHWGLGRAAQIVFVVVVFAAQIVLSHWWLRHFRYGPMEWLWRAFTYGRTPAFRVGATPLARGAPSA